MKWPWQRRKDSGAKQRAEAAERQLHAAKKMTARVERLTDSAVLSADEFARRVHRAFPPGRT